MVLDLWRALLGLSSPGRETVEEQTARHAHPPGAQLLRLSLHAMADEECGISHR
jgi:hypothetical protein